MKVVQVHNYYQQAGGEDGVVAVERAMLEEHENVVVPYYKTNNDIPGDDGGLQSEVRGRNIADRSQRSIISRLSSIFGLLRVSAKTLWNWETYREIRELLQQEMPDVVHCHNTFPIISPSIYWACAKEKVPVVLTLHNYRLLCLNAFLFRQGRNRHEALGTRHSEEIISHEGTESSAGTVQNPAPSAQHPTPGPSGAICEKCISKSLKWPGIKFSCYRDSTAGSLVIAVMLFFHKLIGTWSKKVTAYIALTEFQKEKMIEGGMPADKIWVKPNFIQQDDLATKRHKKHENEENTSSVVENPYCLFVGRLSPEKGCDVLIRAWARFAQKTDIRGQISEDENRTSDLRSPTSANEKRPSLLIVGDGPEREALEKLSSDLGLQASVSFLGKQPNEEVLPLMRKAEFLVFPSIWYETFGLTVLEAGLVRTPSIVSSPTTTSGLLVDMETGLLFPSGNDEVLAEKIKWAFEHAEEMTDMAEAVRTDFESKYSAKVNYLELMDIYGQAMASA